MAQGITTVKAIESYARRVLDGANALQADFEKADHAIAWGQWAIGYYKWLLAHTQGDTDVNAAFWLSDAGHDVLDAWIQAFEKWQGVIRYYWKAQSPDCPWPKKATGEGAGTFRYHVALKLRGCIQETDPSFLAQNALRRQYTEWHISFGEWRSKWLAGDVADPDVWIGDESRITELVQWDTQLINWRKIYLEKTGRKPSTSYSDTPAPPGGLLPNFGKDTSDTIAGAVKLFGIAAIVAAIAYAIAEGRKK